MNSTAKITSPSFPNGLPDMGSEADARAARPLSMIDVIRAAAMKDKCCPWCGTPPGLAIRAGRYLVGCENENCPADVQVASDTLAGAWSAWNRRST